MEGSMICNGGDRRCEDCRCGKQAPKRGSFFIGLTGGAGAGKSSVAKMLQKHPSQPFVTIKFAEPIKDMLGAYLRHAGVHPDDVIRFTEGEYKERPLDILGGHSPRYAMQTIGTEWGREVLAPDLWTKLAIQRATRLMSMGFNVVIDDCRFDNEAIAINAAGGKVFRVEGRRARGITNHTSEHGIHQSLVWDSINNGGDWAQTCAEVSRVILGENQ